MEPFNNLGGKKIEKVSFCVFFIIMLRALSSLRGLRGAPEVPPLCRETQSLGQQMLERWEQMG